MTSRSPTSQVGWTSQLPWSAGTIDQRRFDGLRLLRQVPAVTALSQLDLAGIEQLKVLRVATDVTGSKTDYSQDLKFSEAMAKKVYYGPVYFFLPEPKPGQEPPQPQPYMTLSLATSPSASSMKFVRVLVARQLCALKAVTWP